MRVLATPVRTRVGGRVVADRRRESGRPSPATRQGGAKTPSTGPADEEMFDQGIREALSSNLAPRVRRNKVQTMNHKLQLGPARAPGGCSSPSRPTTLGRDDLSHRAERPDSTVPARLDTGRYTRTSKPQATTAGELPQVPAGISSRRPACARPGPKPMPTNDGREMEIEAMGAGGRSGRRATGLERRAGPAALAGDGRLRLRARARSAARWRRASAGCSTRATATTWPSSVAKMAAHIPSSRTPTAGPGSRSLRAAHRRARGRRSIVGACLFGAEARSTATCSGPAPAGALPAPARRARESRRRALDARKGHFPPDLLASQYAALEPLTPDEDGPVVDADQPVEAQVAAALRGWASIARAGPALRPPWVMPLTVARNGRESEG